MTRRTRFGVALATTAVAVTTAIALALAGGKASRAAMPAPHPTVSDYQCISGGTTPPSEAACEAVARTCFTPQAIQSAYNVGPLYAAGKNGSGVTIAIVDSWGATPSGTTCTSSTPRSASSRCAARRA